MTNIGTGVSPEHIFRLLLYQIRKHYIILFPIFYDSLIVLANSTDFILHVYEMKSFLFRLSLRDSEHLTQSSFQIDHTLILCTWFILCYQLTGYQLIKGFPQVKKTLLARNRGWHVKQINGTRKSCNCSEKMSFATFFQGNLRHRGKLIVRYSSWR